MSKPLGVLFDLGDTVSEYYHNNPIEGTKKILEVSDDPHRITAEQIQELVVKFSVYNFQQ